MQLPDPSRESPLAGPLEKTARQKRRNGACYWGGVAETVCRDPVVAYLARSSSGCSGAIRARLIRGRWMRAPGVEAGGVGHARCRIGYPFAAVLRRMLA